MEKYDISTATRDGLCLVLSTARNEIAKYNSCCKKVENCEKKIAELEKKLTFRPAMLNPGSWFDEPFHTFSCFLKFWSIILVLIILLVSLPFWSIFILPFEYIVFKKKKKPKAQNDIQFLTHLLVGLLKIKTDSVSEFTAIWLIPQKYWNEYALTKMLEYVENKEASNWERVTDKFERHMHEKRMEGIARQSLEQSIIQTELANETRNAARWAAAGAWASAAGIWRR